jgi:hypothetical protein
MIIVSDQEEVEITYVSEPCPFCGHRLQRRTKKLKGNAPIFSQCWKNRWEIDNQDCFDRFIPS